MNAVIYLAPPERPRMDAAQLETLCNELGAHQAEDVVCRAMEELALRLCQVQELAINGPREDLYKGLKALGAIADQIGLCGVRQVSQDVMGCIADGDPVAEAATLARLARIGERSLTALWDLQDLSV
ncbi:MAG: hypothetical protein QNJ09_04910 [Paracoccaceae bacterium]|nr:hypothetical protein [Paracoccaceae bacterium]